VIGEVGWWDELSTFLETRVRPEVERFEKAAEFPAALFRDLCGMGMPAAAISSHPQRVTDYYLSLSLISREWLALAESVHLHVLSMRALTAHGSQELREEMVARMSSGELIGGNCFSEENAGSDLAAIAMSAARTSDGFVLNGRKLWVGHAPIASLLNVYCRTGTPGAAGVSCFLVDASTPGITIEPAVDKMGVKSLPTAHIHFDNVEVGANRMLGRANRGLLIASEVFAHGRLGIAACAVGLAEATVAHAVAYAKSRHQFGNPIIAFQGISFLLADMATQTAAARALVERAVAALQSGRPAPLLTSQAKLFATDTAMRTSTDAVQVLGAYGYTSESPTGRWMREAKLLQIIEGTNQIQRTVIAGYL
jgi:alkylation response protein AidB-like acyl-CoA dehydrogenase